MSFKSVIVLFIMSLIHSNQCWILTDIRPKTVGENNVDDGVEIAPGVSVQLKFNLIYPGTKWCGPGNIADGYDDLGESIAADICCRNHDNCPEYIAGGETKFNLTNEAYFTRLSCGCDEKFRQCLQNADTETAITIGVMYFEAIGTQCYRKDYMITGCVKKGGWFNSKCVEYSYNNSSDQAYQWFDVPNFNSASLLNTTQK